MWIWSFYFIQIIESEGLALFVITCLVCLLKCIFKIFACLYMYDENFFFISNLPFLFIGCFLIGFSFLQWSPNTWCEQMWKFLVVVLMREMRLFRPGPVLMLFWSTFCELCYFVKRCELCEQSFWITVLCYLSAHGHFFVPWFSFILHIMNNCNS